MIYEVTFLARGDSVTEIETIVEEYEASTRQDAEDMVYEDYPGSIVKIVQTVRAR